MPKVFLSLYKVEMKIYKFFKVKLIHIERELGTKLGLIEKDLGDAPLGCTDMLVNTGDQVIYMNSTFSPNILMNFVEKIKKDKHI